MPNILVIGGVTIDTLHLPNQQTPVISPGGAGLYTALACCSMKAQVTLFAQRPKPLPDLLKPIDEVLEWIGPEIALEDLPRLEIAHYGGGKAALLSANWGAQLEISPADLPQPLHSYQAAHVAALGPTANQIRFVDACRNLGIEKISAGTYGRAAYGEPEIVRKLISIVDYFFMNENEAVGLFGAVEKVHAKRGQAIFVTRAEAGAIAVTADDCIHLPAQVTMEIDPTGAGDAFCGATLAAIDQGRAIPDAARLGNETASGMIREIGPTWLMRKSRRN